MRLFSSPAAVHLREGEKEIGIGGEKHMKEKTRKMCVHEGKIEVVLR